MRASSSSPGELEQRSKPVAVPGHTGGAGGTGLGQGRVQGGGLRLLPANDVRPSGSLQVQPRS